MKLHVLKNGDSITYASVPFLENDQPSQEFEVTPEDMKEVQEGIKDWHLLNNALSTMASNRKAEKEELLVIEAGKAAEKQALKDKLLAGTATLEEMQRALSELF